MLLKARHLIRTIPKRTFASSTRSQVLIETQELEDLIKEGRDDLSIVNSAMMFGKSNPKADHA